MKKKLIEAIKAKFVGIDDNTAGRLAERAMRKGDPITTDDEVAAAVEAMTLSDVLKSVSDFSSDDAVKKYEAKHNLKDGSPVKTEPQPAEGEDGSPEGKQTPQKPADNANDDIVKMLKEFAGKIETMGADIASIKAGKLAEGRKTKLEQVIKGLREPQKKAYGRIQVDKMTDDEFDAFLAEVREEVNEIIAEDKANGVIVKTPIGGEHNAPRKGKEATEEELDALADKFGLPKQEK